MPSASRAPSSPAMTGVGGPYTSRFFRKGASEMGGVISSLLSGQAWLCYLLLYLRCLYSLFFTMPEQECECVEHNHQYKEHPIANQHTQVLQPTSDHDTQQVRGKGDIRGLTIPE